MAPVSRRGHCIFNLSTLKTMSGTTYHMALDIEGVLTQYKRKKIKFFTNDDGTKATDSEARAFLAQCQVKGWKLIPCSSECEGFDPFKHGCPGHPKEPTNGNDDKGQPATATE